jgi:starch phosphorylase
MIAEYTRRFYNPAFTKYNYLTETDCSRAREFSKWKAEVNAAWPEIAVKEVVMEVRNGNGNKKLNPKQSQLKVGSELSVRALVGLGKISPKDISVELYYGPVDTWGNIKQGSAIRMDYKEGAEPQGEHWFTGSMSCRNAGQHGVAVRVLPMHEDLVNPYEMGLILWESTN